MSTPAAREKRKRRETRIKWIIIALLGVIVAASLGLGAYLYFHSLQEDELRESLIANCERNGNPLREVLQHRIKREIKQNENQALFEKIFPNIPPEDLRALAHKAIVILEQEEIEVAPVNCQHQYEPK